MSTRRLGSLLAVSVLMLGASAFLLGCEGDGSEGASPSVDVTGVWRGVAEGVSFLLDLTQAGASVSGTAISESRSAPVSGEVDGNTVRLTVGWIDVDETIEATVTGNSMGGTVRQQDIVVGFTANR